MALVALQNVIGALDPNRALQALSYPLSYNSQLGYNDSDPFSPFQFIPYGSWKNYDNQPDPLPSVLEQAFRDTIVVGHSYNGQIDKENSFVDILHLGQPDPLFFNEPLVVGPSATKTVVEVIADTVNAMDPTITPVIRFLVGNPNSTNITCPTEFTDSFWPSSSNGQSIFTHPNAMLYVGSFNPNISLEADLQNDINAWFNNLTNTPEPYIIDQLVSLLGTDWEWAINDTVGFIFSELDKWVDGLVDAVLADILPQTVPPLSWNHAKIVAVNGRALLTGGGNYYDFYTSKLGGSLIDNDITILGDAAVTAHNYSDYLWAYLNSNHQASDQGSRVWSTKLNVPRPSIGKGIPPGGIAPYFPTNIPGLTGTIPVLTTGKIGNFDPITGVAYPSQILDAVRDVLWQLIWEWGPVDLSILGLGNVNLLPLIAEYTGDAYMEADLAGLNVSAASWASRIARVEAVSAATDYVYMSQQMLVNWDMTAVPVWNSAVDTINSKLGLSWDGKVWPYDLLMAFAKAITTIEASHPTDPSGPGVYVVLSTRDWATGAGYQDNTTLSDLTSRLTDVMTSMATLGLLGNNVPFKPDQVPEVVKRRFHAKRSDLAMPPQFIEKKLHTKVVDVDGKLLYTGSDNAYPQWNEQFGVWIEDAVHIQQWEDGFFLGLWARALAED